MTSSDPKGFRFRESTRAPYETNVVLRFERDGEPSGGYSANVSMEGMFVRTDDPRAVGTLVQFEFDLEGSTIQGLGDIVWIRTRPLGADKPPGMGVQFRYVDPQSRDLIAKIVDRYLQSGRAPELDGTAGEPPTPASPAVDLAPPGEVSKSEAPTAAVPGVGVPPMPPPKPPAPDRPISPPPVGGSTSAADPRPSSEALPPPLDQGTSSDSLSDFELSDLGSEPAVDPALEDALAPPLAERPLRAPTQPGLPSMESPTQSMESPRKGPPTEPSDSPAAASSAAAATRPQPPSGASVTGPPEKAWTPPPASRLPGGEGGKSEDDVEVRIEPLAGATGTAVVGSAPRALGSEKGDAFDPLSMFSEAEPAIGGSGAGTHEDAVDFEETVSESKSPPRFLIVLVLLLILAAAGWFLRDRVGGLFGGSDGDVTQASMPEQAPPATDLPQDAGPQELESLTESPEGLPSEDDLSRELSEDQFLSEFEDLESDDLGSEESDSGSLIREDAPTEPTPAVRRSPQEARPRTAVPEDAGSAPSQLTEISASSTGSGTVIRIRGNGSIAAGGFTALELSGPPRLLVRINGVTSPYDTGALSGQEFSRVRSGLHNTAERGPEIHLVVDLTSESVRSEVVPEGDGLLIRLSP